MAHKSDPDWQRWGLKMIADLARLHRQKARKPSF